MKEWSTLFSIIFQILDVFWSFKILRQTLSKIFGVYDINMDQQYLNAVRPTKSKSSLERWTGKEVSEAAKAPRAGGMEPEGAGVCRFLQPKNGP